MMKKILIMAAVFSLCFYYAKTSHFVFNNCLPTDGESDSIKNAQEYFAPATSEVTQKFSFRKLQLVPIIAGERFRHDSMNYASYTPLQDALQKKKVKISENGNGETASVNDLTISNNSKDTVILLAGDIITGGKQDRIVANDIVLNPGQKNISIPVFCIEPHRWTAEKNDYNFKGSGKKVSNKVRYAAVKTENQSMVWQKVGEVTKMNSAEANTGSYNALDTASVFSNETKEYENFFRDKFKNEKHVIGVIAMSGDSVLACDIFCNEKLFKSQYQSLMYTYITDAITYGNDRGFDDKKVNSYYKDRLTKRYFAKDDEERITISEKEYTGDYGNLQGNRQGFTTERKSPHKNGLKFKSRNKIVHYSDL